MRNVAITMDERILKGMFLSLLTNTGKHHHVAKKQFIRLVNTEPISNLIVRRTWLRMKEKADEVSQSNWQIAVNGLQLQSSLKLPHSLVTERHYGIEHLYCLLVSFLIIR